MKRSISSYVSSTTYFVFNLTGDNTEKIWVHQFLAKPKTIATGDLGGAVRSPGDPAQCLGEGVGVKLLNNFVFFSI